MNKSDLRKIIKEEIQKVLKESLNVDPTLKAELQRVAKDRKRYQEDEDIFSEMQSIITQIILKSKSGMSKSEAKSLASGIMEDETTLSGSVNSILGTIQDSLEEDDDFNIEAIYVEPKVPSSVALHWFILITAEGKKGSEIGVRPMSVQASNSNFPNRSNTYRTMPNARPAKGVTYSTTMSPNEVINLFISNGLVNKQGKGITYTTKSLDGWEDITKFMAKTNKIFKKK